MTEDAEHFAKRLMEVEMRITHQDKIIGELNDVIAAQWQKIDALERQLRRVDEELMALDVDTGPAHQKPPHY